MSQWPTGGYCHNELSSTDDDCQLHRYCIVRWQLSTTQILCCYLARYVASILLYIICPTKWLHFPCAGYIIQVDVLYLPRSHWCLWGVQPCSGLLQSTDLVNGRGPRENTRFYKSKNGIRNVFPKGVCYLMCLVCYLGDIRLGYLVSCRWVISNYGIQLF